MKTLLTQSMKGLETLHSASTSPRARLEAARRQLQDFEAQLDRHARWGLSRRHRNLFAKYRRKLEGEIAQCSAAIRKRG